MLLSFFSLDFGQKYGIFYWPLLWSLFVFWPEKVANGQFLGDF